MNALKPTSVAGIFFQLLANVLDMAIEHSMRLRVIVAKCRNKQLLARKCMARFLSHTKQDVELIGGQTQVGAVHVRIAHGWIEQKIAIDSNDLIVVYQ